MANQDDTTEPLSKNDEHKVAELASRLEALEQAFEKRGYNTQPIWEVLQERLEKAETKLDKPVKQKAIKQIKPNTQQCLYCHNGIYVEALDSRHLTDNQLVNQLTEWGLSYRLDKPSKDWIIFACNYCGNLQVFNVANVQNTKAWK